MFVVRIQYANLGKAHPDTHASVLVYCQTMMSSQVQPGQHSMFWETSSATAEPFIHDVKARPAEAGVQFCHLYREVMVEPDGIEPTTSCLQSTRSTN